MKEPRRDRARTDSFGDTAVDTVSVVAPADALATPVAPASAPRLFTARDWARGRNDGLTRAFLACVSQERIDKKTQAEWSEIYRNWLTQPRG